MFIKVLVCGVMIGLLVTGAKGCIGGKGNGNGTGTGVANEGVVRQAVVTTAVRPEKTEVKETERKEEKEEEKTLVIKVEEKNIFVNDVACDGVEDLGKKIRYIADIRDYKIYFEHDYAIKSTYEEVREELSELEEVLEIKIIDG